MEKQKQQTDEKSRFYLETAPRALPFIESDAPTKKGRQSPTGLFPTNGAN